MRQTRAKVKDHKIKVNYIFCVKWFILSIFITFVVKMVYENILLITI